MQCHKELVHLLIHHLKLPPQSLWDVTWCVSVHVKAEGVNLPLLVCLIFGLSMAVIARPHALLSACSCTSTHPTPAFPSASLSSPSPTDLLQCSRQLGGWVNTGRGGEWKEKRGGEEEGEELPLFFPHACAHAQCPPPLPFTLFIVVHPPVVHEEDLLQKRGLTGY